jgi:hypothetical protein
VGKSKIVPYLLETELKSLGGLYERGPDWVSFQFISSFEDPSVEALGWSSVASYVLLSWLMVICVWYIQHLGLETDLGNFLYCKC